MNLQTTASGIRYYIVREGTGASPRTGNVVKTHYTGWLNSFEGKKFDSSRDRNVPFQFTVGVGQVIQGWDETILNMKGGEIRRIILPHQLAYGSRGAGDVIPPFSELYFEMELLQ